MTDLPKLQEIDGVLQGQNTIKLKVLGANDVDGQGRHLFFDGFAFVGYPQRLEGQPTVDHNNHYHGMRYINNWAEALAVTEESEIGDVVDALDELSDYGYESKLFELEITYKIKEINTFQDDFLGIRKYNALGKLSEDEIKMLGLQQDAVYLKLKYGGEQRDDDDYIF